MTAPAQILHPAGIPDETVRKPGPTYNRPSLPLLALHWLAGVLLPLAAVIVELSTGICAQAFFDPLPTVLHTIAFLLIPASNAIALLTIHHRRIQPFAILGWVNGLAVGVAGFYTLIFLPITPIAVIAILFMGLGFCALAPLFSLITAIRLRKHLKRLAAHDNVWWFVPAWKGMLIASVILAGIEISPLLTRAGMYRAVSDSAETSRSGIALLRTFGNDEILLRHCYQRRGMADIAGFVAELIAGRTLRTDEARSIYYRVTGRPFNAVPPPLHTHGPLGRETSELEFDEAQGADLVGGRLAHLTLAASRIDVTVDPSAALAYTEWTMEFRNSGSVLQHEARTRVALPHDGVVSRLTLWINGEERDAAFGGRAQTRTAYSAVVAQRRDPVLVTTCGPDQILMNCFPVPPRGTMRVRIGITSPLILHDDHTARYRPPFIVERNYGLPSASSHSLWIESTGALAASPALAAAGFGHRTASTLHGGIPHTLLSSGEASFTVDRSHVPATSWTRSCDNDAIVVQDIVHQQSVRPAMLYVVVDGSIAMREHAGTVAASLRAIRHDIPLTVYLAGDDVTLSAPDDVATHTYAGGCDNIPALVMACTEASGDPGSRVMWITGPQPELLTASDPLEQALQRSSRLSLDVVPVSPGPNRVLEKLDGVPRVGVHTDGETTEQRITSISNEWLQGSPAFHRSLSSLAHPPTGHQTSLHLARLFARDQVVALVAAGKREEATKLALTYQLVTPVSGAVVLENKQQYAAAGLEPVAPGTVPSVPEPATVLLVGVALTLLLIAFRMQRAAV